MPLTDSRIRKIRPSAKTAKFADGGGLTLLVTPGGSKLWRLRYRYDGKQKELAFGRYPAVSLARARERREESKILLAQGIDPRAAQIKAEAERLAVTEHTFGEISDELLAKLRAEGVAEVTLRKKQWLLDIAGQDIGSRPIRDLPSAMVLETLRKVEKTGRYETANRLRSTIGQVCRYAISTARLDNDPTAALKGALVSPAAKHQAAITDKVGFEGLVRDLWSYEGSISTQVGLKLLVLIYPRPGELRRARWTEFDLDAGTWTIPPEHEKNRRQHVKPLPQTAIELLRRQH
ncbi:MAG: tyrosine-type recombinase/integrase, partial [Henriciella sp.]